MWISRLCEEFHCRPSEAIQEWERAPAGLLESILEVRAFIAAKQVYDRAENKNQIPDEPLVQLVKAFDFAEAESELAAKVAAMEEAEGNAVQG
jgi:hypothetical protein